MGISERKEREKTQRREQILDAAEGIFFTQGVEKATMDSLADAAELSKGTLYLYFKSKEDIHYAVTQRGLQRLYERMKQMDHAGKDAVENLMLLADAFIQFCEEEAELANSILFFQACDFKNLNIDQDQIKDHFLNNSPIQLVTEFVAEGVKQGILRTDIPIEIISHTLWAQLMGVIQISAKKKALFDLVNITQQDILECHFKIVLNGLKI